MKLVNKVDYDNPISLCAMNTKAVTVVLHVVCHLHWMCFFSGELFNAENSLIEMHKLYRA